MRTARRPGTALASFLAAVALVTCGTARARGEGGIVVPGVAVGYGEWLSVSGTAFAPVISSGFRLAGPIARAELGLGGFAFGLGAAAGGLMDDHIRYVGLEMRVFRTFGLSPWPDAMYLGPQLTLGVNGIVGRFGWMFDPADATNNHPQLGFGLGF